MNKGERETFFGMLILASGYAMVGVAMYRFLCWWWA